jgi:branched-chain amino acid transport system ATP-binding protein
MLEVENIHVYYGDSYILQGVSLAVGADEIVCLLGRNGAGKSTTIRSILGYVPPARGKITFAGEVISGKPVFDNVRRGLGYVAEDRRIFADLTVDENLEVARLPSRSGQTPWSEERIFAAFPLLAPLRCRKGGELSGGEQQMLAIARALAGNPRFLLLDEPCEGLAPLIVQKLGEIVAALKGEMPVLLAEQNARFAFAVSDRGYVIDKGMVRYQGGVGDLMANREVQTRYLAV